MMLFTIYENLSHKVIHKYKTHFSMNQLAHGFNLIKVQPSR